MAVGFDAQSLDQSYAFLDDCPEQLLADVVTLPVGTLSDRATGVIQWRRALLEGRMPSEQTWPPMEIAAPARRALTGMGLVRFCEDQPELVDALLKDLLASFARQARALQADVLQRLRELEALEIRRLTTQEAARAQREMRAPSRVVLGEERRQRLREQAGREEAEKMRPADGELMAVWSERARAWSEIAGVFGDLGEMLGRGWDLARGVLCHTGWQDLLRLRECVEQLPELRNIIRALGRLHVSDNDDSVAETIVSPMRRMNEEMQDVRTPLVPAETRGIIRSGELARMLPVEALMLGHPQLRLLWHARRAERALLTYRVEGVDRERLWAEREVLEDAKGERPRPERGPIVAVIDTSGSMQGIPEQVAKALVLEAMRTAHLEKRRCLVFAFSGPGDVVEHELDLSHDGISRLLAFLGLSFGGGTDGDGVMRLVLERLKEQQWKKADVLVVSDGFWHAPAALVASSMEAKDNGTRLHGVQIGSLGKTGLHAVCDPVHVFSDWAAAGGW